MTNRMIAAAGAAAAVAVAALVIVLATSSTGGQDDHDETGSNGTTMTTTPPSDDYDDYDPSLEEPVIEDEPAESAEDIYRDSQEGAGEFRRFPGDKTVIRSGDIPTEPPR